MAVNNFSFASYAQNVIEPEATVTLMVRRWDLEKVGLRKLFVGPYWALSGFTELWQAL